MGRRIVGPTIETVRGKRVRKTTGDETDYAGRLKDLIPGEAAALYITGVALIPKEDKMGLVGLTVWAVLCFLLSVVYTAWQTRVAEGKPKSEVHKPDWVHVAITSFSFVLWVYTLGGPFQTYGIYYAWIGALIALVWTFVVPIFYTGPKVK